MKKLENDFTIHIASYVISKYFSIKFLEEILNIVDDKYFFF